MAAGNTPTATGKPQTNPSGKSKKTGKSNKRRTWEDEHTDEWLLDGKSTETIRKYRGHVDNLYQFLMEHCDIQPNEWYTQVTYTNLLASKCFCLIQPSNHSKNNQTDTRNNFNRIHPMFHRQQHDDHRRH